MLNEELLPYVNDAGAFEDFYSREYGSFLAAATVLTGDRRDGEDLVQDTMIKTYLRWDRVRVLTKPGAWCLRVLTNACRSRWRRVRTEQRFLARQPRTELIVAGPTDDDLVFWEAVRRLPARMRMVVALYYAADKSTTEVASILNVPPGTVGSDLSRARAVLAIELERHHD